MVVMTCGRNDLLDYSRLGRFKISELEYFSKNTETDIFIRDVGMIKSGKFETFEEMESKKIIN